MLCSLGADSHSRNEISFHHRFSILAIGSVKNQIRGSSRIRAQVLKIILPEAEGVFEMGRFESFESRIKGPSLGGQ